MCRRWLSAGPEIQRSDQHLAPLPHPLSSITGQHLFIATHPQSLVNEARIGFDRLRRLHLALACVELDENELLLILHFYIFVKLL